MPNPVPSPIHVYFALLPGSLVLDWAGPAEALRIANQTLAKQGQPERFVQHFVSPTPESVSSVGAVLTRLEPLPPPCPAPPGWCWWVWRDNTSQWTVTRLAHCCTGCAGCALWQGSWSWSPCARARCWQPTPAC